MYKVIWKPWAVRQLELLCADLTPGRSEQIARVADFVETFIAIRPRAYGRQRSGNTRTWIGERLVITYDVIEEDRRIDILGVHPLTPTDLD